MRRETRLKKIVTLSLWLDEAKTLLWEAIGDLRKNIGDLRSETVQKIREDADRSEELNAALQRFNERLSKLEGEVQQRKIEQNQIGTLGECVVSLNKRLSEIEYEPKAAAAFHHLTGMNARIEALEELDTTVTIPARLFSEIVNKK